MAEDDRALMERLAVLEAEVKADADAQTKRKEAALAKVREQRAAQQAEKDDLRAREVALVTRKPAARKPAPAEDDDGAADDDTGLGGAIELANKANRVHKELAKTPGKGEKSWVKSGLASLVLGPLGWIYAGSLREAIPASAAWLVFATVASKILPTFLMMPILLLVMPLSAIAGVVYAMQFNRSGKRQRLFDKDKDKTKDKGAKLLRP